MSRTDRQGPRRADVARGLSERAGLFIRACVTAALGLRHLLGLRLLQLHFQLRHLLPVVHFSHAQLLLTPKFLPILRAARWAITRHMATKRY